MYLYKALVRGLYTFDLEVIISIIFLGFMGDTSRKRTKETDSTIKGELNPKIKFVLFERTFKITG